MCVLCLLQLEARLTQPLLSADLCAPCRCKARSPCRPAWRMHCAQWGSCFMPRQTPPQVWPPLRTPLRLAGAGGSLQATGAGAGGSPQTLGVGGPQGSGAGAQAVATVLRPSQAGSTLPLPSHSLTSSPPGSSRSCCSSSGRHVAGRGLGGVGSSEASPLGNSVLTLTPRLALRHAGEAGAADVAATVVIIDPSAQCLPPPLGLAHPGYTGCAAQHATDPLKMNSSQVDENLFMPCPNMSHDVVMSVSLLDNVLSAFYTVHHA